MMEEGMERSFIDVRKETLKGFLVSGKRELRALFLTLFLPCR